MNYITYIYPLQMLIALFLYNSRYQQIHFMMLGGAMTLALVDIFNMLVLAP